MKKAAFHVVISVLFAAVPGVLSAEGGPPKPADPDPQQVLVEKAIEIVKPSLVRIHVVWTEYEGGREVKFETFGSGSIITPEGDVVTNHHVVGRAKQINCTLFNRDEVDAELVGTDPLTDIAVIRLIPKKKLISFVAATFGDSSKLRVGDTVLAMGSPLALSQSVTKGIVSNTEMIQPRIFGNYKFKLEGEDVGSIVRWIGHDAPIFGGNSGGPLVNLQGEIVGVNEISIGLAGAIPGNIARDVADKIIKKGRVDRAWLGVEIQPLLEGQKAQTGILVSGTIEGSPAEKAGFKSGDIIKKLSGREVVARFDEEIPLFNQFVQGLAMDREHDAVVLRGGKEITLKIKPVAREEVRPRPKELMELGITARNISLMMAKELRRKDQDGVLVTSVRAGGPCAEAKPRIGEKDVITAVNGLPVRNLEDAGRVVEALLSGKKEEKVAALVAFEREDEKYLTMVSLGSVQPPNPAVEVKKSWLPFAFQVLSPELASRLGAEGKKGVRITQVYPVKEAADSKVKVGDMIVSLDKQELPVSQPEDYEMLPAMIRQYKIGSKVELGILRDGNPVSASIILPAAPPQTRELKRFRSESFEFEARDISFMDRVNEHWGDDLKGVVVDEVTQGGWAAIGHMTGGDLLLSVDGRETAGIEALKKVMAEVEKERPAVIVFHVLRRIHHIYLQVRPGWPKKS